MLPKWVKVPKNRVDEIQSIVTEAKNNKSKTNVGKIVITVNNREELIKDTACGKIEKKKQKTSSILLLVVM